MKIIIYITFTFFTLNIYSNITFGYVVTNELDTLKGYIKDSQENSRSYQVRFREDFNSNYKKYEPKDIKGYAIYNESIYVSKEITFNGKKVSLFLEFLVKGDISLYSFQTPQRELYFVLELRDGKQVLLANPKKQVVVNNVQQEIETGKYLGVLKYVFNSIPSLDKMVNETSFEKKSLVDLIVQYHVVNEMEAGSVDYYNNPVVNSSEFIQNERENIIKSLNKDVNYGPLLGLGFTKNTIETYIQDYLMETHKCSKQVVHIGAFVNFKLSSPDFYFKIQPEIWYKQYSFIDGDIDKMLKFYEIPVHAELGMFSGNTKMFINVGAKNTFTNYQMGYAQKTTYLKDENGYLFGYFMGVGLNYTISNKKAVFIRIQYGKDVRTQNYYSGRLRFESTNIMPVVGFEF